MVTIREIEHMESMEAIFAGYAEDPNNTLDQQAEYGHARVKAKVKVLQLKYNLTQELEEQGAMPAVEPGNRI